MSKTLYTNGTGTDSIAPMADPQDYLDRLYDVANILRGVAHLAYGNNVRDTTTLEGQFGLLAASCAGQITQHCTDLATYLERIGKL
jgi:hypothetical protein